ncbi:MAG: hydrogenase subunit MbhD domain-containing protein [Spirochaetia bacterium]
MTDIVLILLVIVAVLSLQVRNLLTAVILISVFSLLSSFFFFILHAPDVALTEAAVGTGVGTLVFVWAVHKTERRDNT